MARFEGRDAMLAEVFTHGELTYCRGRRRPWPHLAARFAAKEATLKALGTGVAGRMQWRDISISRDPAGAPHLLITGATSDVLAEQRLRAGSVSLSHGRTVAIAVVLLLPT